MEQGVHIQFLRLIKEKLMSTATAVPHEDDSVIAIYKTHREAEEPVRNGQEAIEQSEQSKGDRTLLRVWSRGGSRYIVIDASKKG